MNAPAWILAGFLVVTWLFVFMLTGQRDELLDRLKRTTAALRKARAQVAELTDRIAEHEARETALKIICKANGIEVVDPDQPLPLMDEAELVAVESPDDIVWTFPEQRGGEGR